MRNVEWSCVVSPSSSSAAKWLTREALSIEMWRQQWVGRKDDE